MPGFPAVEETIMQTVITINAVIMALFFVCYSYQFFYVAVALLKRKKFIGRNENHRIAILIAARNEENVIGYLLDSICAQTYPMDHVDVYVGADNCTDDTARVAREHGAIVFERHDTLHVGKGYVLNDMLRRIRRPGRRHYDAYLVLDADNILDPNFLSEIEKVYSAGYEIVTCYRNSKNYGDNWISAGYALWFLREAQYLNNARMRLGSSCAVSGTGFLFPTVCCKDAAAGTSSCSRRTSNLPSTMLPAGKKSAMRAVRCSMMSSPRALPSPGGSACAGRRGICRFSASTLCSFSPALRTAAFPAMT